MARWGMPGPPQFGGAPNTNIRNVGSPHWRGWLGKQNRCIVPATSFCEYADTKPRETPKWFALSQDRLLFAFAGLWTPWRGVRRRRKMTKALSIVRNGPCTDHRSRTPAPSGNWRGSPLARGRRMPSHRSRSLMSSTEASVTHPLSTAAPNLWSTVATSSGGEACGLPRPARELTTVISRRAPRPAIYQRYGR
jgi:hypothetical protein